MKMWKTLVADDESCLNSTHTDLILRRGGRKEAEGRRCRFSRGFLGCGEALHLCVWLIAFHINHRYRARGIAPLSWGVWENKTAMGGKGAQWSRGTRWQLCVWVVELVIKFTLTAGPLLSVYVCGPEKNEWCCVTEGLTVIIDPQSIV